MRQLRTVLAVAALATVAALAGPPGRQPQRQTGASRKSWPRQYSRSRGSYHADQTGPPVSGWILTPDGEPAVGAKVFTLGEGRSLAVAECTRVMLADCAGTKTDRIGFYSFPVSPGFAWHLVVLHPRGYLVADGEKRKGNDEFSLQAWGRIEGVCRIGAPPFGFDPMSAWTPALFLPGDGKPRIHHSLDTRADAEGSFVFPRVPPGDWEVGVCFSYTGDSSSLSHRRKVSVPPGKTATVRIGGTGRPIVGKFALPEGVRVNGAWRRCGRSLLAVPKLPMKKPKYPEMPVEKWQKEARENPDFDHPYLQEVEELYAMMGRGKEDIQKELLDWYVLWVVSNKVQEWRDSAKAKAYEEAFARYKEAYRKASGELEYSIFSIQIDAQGRFRIEDVPAGAYELQATWRGGEIRRGNVIDYEAICTLEHEFTVPAIPGGRSDEPLDVGTLVVTPVTGKVE